MSFYEKAVSYFRRTFGLTETYGLPDRHPTDSGESVDVGRALGLSTAWGCVSLIAGTGGSLPANVYRPGGTIQLVDNSHWLQRIIHDSPNADQTALDFWEFMFASIELQGHAYSEILRRDDGSIIGLDVPVAPDAMNVERRGDGSYRYEWWRYGERHTADQNRMFHVRGPLGGMSTLATCRQVFGTALATERAAGATFKNGARPSGTVEVKQMLQPDKRKELEGALENRFTGAVNAGRPMVLDNGASWKAISLTPDDAQMLESRRFSVEEICRIFGVPPHMVGHTENSTSWGTGLEQQTIGFVMFTLRKRLKRFEQAVMKQLLSPRDIAAGISVQFNIEGLLRGDSKSRGEFYATGLQNGWRTINEVRALENLPPVSGGDVPHMQSQNIPINLQVGPSLVAAKPSSAPAPGGE